MWSERLLAQTHTTPWIQHTCNSTVWLGEAELGGAVLFILCIKPIRGEEVRIITLWHVRKGRRHAELSRPLSPPHISPYGEIYFFSRHTRHAPSLCWRPEEGETFTLQMSQVWFTVLISSHLLLLRITMRCPLSPIWRVVITVDGVINDFIIALW